MTIWEQLEKDFPSLKGQKYEITHEEDDDYNCIAWAAGDKDSWWEPIEKATDGVYWPETAPKNYSVEALIKAFETKGYRICESGDFEAGFEKIAIYAKGGLYEHASRQVFDERLWTSKLGELEVIMHDLKDMESKDFGQVVLFLSRPMAGAA